MEKHFLALEGITYVTRSLPSIVANGGAKTDGAKEESPAGKSETINSRNVKRRRPRPTARDGDQSSEEGRPSKQIASQNTY